VKKLLIGTISIKIFIPTSLSLKDKRSVVRSLITRLKNKFNISVAEIDSLDQWQIAVIGMAIVGNETKILNQQISKIITFIEANTDFELINLDTEIF